MNNKIKEITLSELLETDFTVNEDMEMVGTFTLDRINMISDILTNLQEENERLKDLYRRTIDHLFKIGNDELARYFQAQINDCPSFIPQDLRGDE